MTDINSGSHSNFQQNASLRTHQRLGDIIDKYNTYITEQEANNANFIQTPSSAPGAPSSFKPKYEYYHFQRSPSGIDNHSLGRILAELFSDIQSWHHNNETNTTNAWLMTLGKTQQILSALNQSYITDNHTQNQVHVGN
jgi:hypothetical protein